MQLLDVNQLYAAQCIMPHRCTHAHTSVPFFRDHPGEPVPEESFFWTYIVQGKITEADTH